MYIGDVDARTREEAERFRQLTYTCLEDKTLTRDPQTINFPTVPCPGGIMTALRFPKLVYVAAISVHSLLTHEIRCWDGKNLDSPDHMAHMSYPESGTFENGGKSFGVSNYVP